MITEKLIREAYLYLRTSNTIPDEVLQFILDASLEKLYKIAEEEAYIKCQKDVEANKDFLALNKNHDSYQMEHTIRDYVFQEVKKEEILEEAIKTIKSIDLECNNENHDSYQMEHAIRDIVFDFLSKYEGRGLR